MKHLFILIGILFVSCSRNSVDSNYFHNEAEILFKEYNYQTAYQRKTSSSDVFYFEINKKI